MSQLPAHSFPWMMANSRNLIRNIRVTKPAQDTVGLENLAPFVRCNSSRVGMQLANLRLTSPRNNLVTISPSCAARTTLSSLARNSGVNEPGGFREQTGFAFVRSFVLGLALTLQLQPSTSACSVFPVSAHLRPIEARGDIALSELARMQVGSGPQEFSLLRVGAKAMVLVPFRTSHGNLLIPMPH